MSSIQNPTKSFFLLKKNDEPEIGFTTGTCAAAASVAAARMLLTGEIVQYVILTTPKGIKVCIEIENQKIESNSGSCSVRKFSGTDPDITNGIEVFSTVMKNVCHPAHETVNFPQIKITGGAGVGRVTLPGLDQKPGEAAINSVPRKMIFDGVAAELKRAGKTLQNCANSSFEVKISVPHGEEIASQTFNPKLGIVGGISILGTSGIVEPMSEQALLDTIQVELNVRKAQKYEILPLVPGNYGADFLQAEFSFSVETAVHCSNFVYDAVQMAVKTGFKKVLFCGHIGKLVKVAGGIKNTHSKYGDHRMEIISEVAKKFVSEDKWPSVQKELLSCISTEQAVKVLDSLASLHSREKIMKEIAGRIQKNMIEWSQGKLEVEVIIFTKENGLLAETSVARTFIMEMQKK